MRQKLSIIIPSLRPYNFSELITNLEVNSDGDIEIIAVTNEEIISSYKDYNILPIKFIIDDKKIGTTYAIQKGLEHCTGDFIITLSDDCLIAPNAFQHMFNGFGFKSSTPLCIGNFQVYDHTGLMPKLGYFGKQFSMFPFTTRQTIDKLGMYYSTEFNSYFSDPDLGIRLAEKGGYIYNCPTAFIYHRFNNDEIYRNNKSKYFKKDEETFIKKWYKLGIFQGVETLK